MLAGGLTAEELYERTVDRAYVLKHQHHYRLFEIWECQWQAILRRREDIREVYDRCFVPPPLDPRKHALRGGRTEAFQLMHVKADDEVIEFFDVVSSLFFGFSEKWAPNRYQCTRPV